MLQTKVDEWHFEFGLCGQNGESITQSECDQLLDVIIDWAEHRGYCIGGGFRPFGESDHRSPGSVSNNA
jgi:hypothetical protein